MYDVILTPDFKKLTQYFELTQNHLDGIDLLQGIPCSMDYQTEESYNVLNTRFELICKNYDLSEHFNELFYLLLKKNEEIRVRYDAFWNNYHDDLTTREVAKFLLAYKEAKPNEHLQLTIKPVTIASASIKDTHIVRWMCDLLVEKIEKGEYPLNIFGEKMAYDLFGDVSSNKPLDLERLKKAAELKLRKPTVRINKLYVELCRYLQNYLAEHTPLSISDDKLLTDAQANFFFDTLEALGYINSDNIQSDAKDYMWALFKNYVNSYISRQ